MNLPLVREFGLSRVESATRHQNAKLRVEYNDSLLSWIVGHFHLKLMPMRER